MILRLRQLTYKQLIFTILSFKKNSIICIFILLVRLISFGLFLNFKKSNQKVIFSIKNFDDSFFLDLRDAKINLHLFTILIQFFTYLSNKFEKLEIWINSNTYTCNPLRPYDLEFIEICNKIQENEKIKVKKIEDKKKISLKKNFLKISYLSSRMWNHDEDWCTDKNIKNLFISNLKFESKPFNFKMSKKIQLIDLNKTFNIAFYPTYDEDCIYENEDRKYGVISKENFLILKNTYEKLVNYIIENKISDVKIILLNKKALNWQMNKLIFDLRNFENFNIKFEDLISFVHNKCQLTLGSEGTLQSFITLSNKPKHIVFIDSSHWPDILNPIGHSIPLFAEDWNYINYKNKPKELIPDPDNVIELFIKEYTKFKNA